MGASQFNLKPIDITSNMVVLSNLLEKQKLCYDKEGILSVDDKWILVNFRRKFGALDIGAIEQTFQKAIEFLRQEGSDEVSLKNTITEIKDKMNDAVTVGLVRQFRVYLSEKKDSAKRFAKLILSTVDQYNKLNPTYAITLNRKVKDEIEELLLDETIKKALVPAPPPPPKKKSETNKRELSEQERKLQEAVLKGSLSHSPVGFVMLEGLGKVNLRNVGIRILTERRKQESTQLFDQKLIDRVRDNEEEWQTVKRKQRGKAPVEQPVDTRLIDALNARRERIV